METCCIDSGSDISLIHKDLLVEIPTFKKVKRVFPFDLSNFYSACVPVNLKLCVAHNAQCRWILGNDFL